MLFIYEPLLFRYGASTFSTNIGLARLLNERNISGEVHRDHNWYKIATALYTKDNRMFARKKCIVMASKKQILRAGLTFSHVISC
jgi:hypothetical protein